MRIGIDLDGVIFDSEKLYRIYSELYDIQDLKKNSLKNNKEIRFQDRYSWSDEETNGFVKKYHRKITEVSNFMPGAKDVISLLKEEGHTLIVITARGKLNKDLIPVTIQRLKDNNLDLFEKYYWGTDNKEEICKQEKIDLMFSHINSTPRENLGGKTPYEIFSFIYGEELAHKLNIQKIAKDEVTTTPRLLK